MSDVDFGFYGDDVMPGVSIFLDVETETLSVKALCTQAGAAELVEWAYLEMVNAGMIDPQDHL